MLRTFYSASPSFTWCAALETVKFLRANCWNVFGHTQWSSHTSEEPSYKIQVSFKENLTFALSACDEIAEYTVYTQSALR